MLDHLLPALKAGMSVVMNLDHNREGHIDVVLYANRRATNETLEIELPATRFSVRDEAALDSRLVHYGQRLFTVAQAIDAILAMRDANFEGEELPVEGAPEPMAELLAELPAVAETLTVVAAAPELPAADTKPVRRRRTKAEIEAATASQTAAVAAGAAAAEAAKAEAVVAGPVTALPFVEPPVVSMRDVNLNEHTPIRSKTGVPVAAPAIVPVVKTETPAQASAVTVLIPEVVPDRNQGPDFPSPVVFPTEDDSDEPEWHGAKFPF
jgi:hypothetical protein